MSTGVNAAVRAPAATARQHRLRRGRTRILALSDLTMLALAYTVSYLIADRIAPLPPVSGSSVVPRSRRRDGAVRLVDGLHGQQPLRQRQPQDLGLELRRDARPLPRDARRLARLPAPLAGCRPLLRLVGVHAGRGLHLPRRRAPADSGRARVDPELDLPARDAAAPDADRRQRRRGAPRLPQDQGAPGVRARDRRLPQRRGRAGRGTAGAGDRLGLRGRRRSSTPTRSTGS